MHDPRISLAIDNCFASKRWTRPAEWAAIVADLGLRAIETSADTECDPLYGGPDYLADWVAEVEEAEREHGVEVVNMYSGHGTYATLGLAHTDARVRERMTRQWLFPLIDVAGRLGAGVGFFCHAFPQGVLRSADAYAGAVGELHDRLAQIAAYAAERLSSPIGVEQMYSPHQYPWRIADALALMRAVTAGAGAPFYVDLDVGHQSGQHRFVRPSRVEIEASLAAPAGGVETWIGPPQADELRDRARAGEVPIAETAERIDAICGESPHLFASDRDTDPYAWLEECGAWSPIVHLQQTTGRSSSHLPFTPEHNDAGIIDGPRVLASLARSVARADAPVAPLPPPVDHIYLTIEVFASTAEHPAMIIEKLRETVRYWRRWVPEDGTPISELTSAVNTEETT